MKEVKFKLPTDSLLNTPGQLAPTRDAKPLASANGGKLRIACLHGFSCNANINKFQTSRLRKYWAEHLRKTPLVLSPLSPRHNTSFKAGDPVVFSDVEFVFLESSCELGPVDKPLAEVTSLFPGPYRSWLEPHDGAQYGRRRDAAVENRLLDDIRAVGPIHGVLAFSDGGAIISSLTLKAEMGLVPKLWDFVVLVCAVDPYLDPVLHDGVPAANKMKGRKTLVRMRTPCVHVIGLEDHVYRERSEELWGMVHPNTRFGSKPTAEVYRFNDGHKVPTSDKDLAEIIGAWRRVVTNSHL
ncbi:serine hydrolase FSH [Diaporthe sp. PMI_573]|nr:serine hydrolase FSH [Diaporthaceae sp. PMI_573]